MSNSRAKGLRSLVRISHNLCHSWRRSAVCSSTEIQDVQCIYSPRWLFYTFSSLDQILLQFWFALQIETTTLFSFIPPPYMSSLEIWRLFAAVLVSTVILYSLACSYKDDIIPGDSFSRGPKLLSIKNYVMFVNQLTDDELTTGYYQQDGATCHTANASMRDIECFF